MASPKREDFLGLLRRDKHRLFIDPESRGRTYQAADERIDIDAVMGAMQTEAAAEAMAYDGVLPETMVILVEA